MARHISNMKDINYYFPGMELNMRAWQGKRGKGRGEVWQERIKKKWKKNMDILEGRRETKGGKGRRRCGGEEAYTPSRQPLKYA